MTELEKMQRAQMYIEKMANGINPLTDSSVPDEDLINNVRISRCLFYVSDILSQTIKNDKSTKIKKEKLNQFTITPEQSANFMFSEAPLTISEIVYRINIVCQNENMKKLSHKPIINFLIKSGLLELHFKSDGKSEKRPTEAGTTIGIMTEERNSYTGTYNIILYNTAAQHFIIDNIDSIITMEIQSKENDGRPWSDEDTELLFELNRKNVSIPEIAEKLKRTTGAVSSRLKK